MILKSYVVINFENRLPEDGLHRISVPEGSIFQAVKGFPDAVRVWYAIPSIEMDINVIQTFATLKPGQQIPDNYIFLDILESTVEVPSDIIGEEPQVKTFLMPIYLRKD